MTLVGRVVSFANLLATEVRATVLPDTPLTTGVFTINCLACVRENFSVTRQGYDAQCWSQMNTKASITETVQAKPPEKAEIFPLPPMAHIMRQRKKRGLTHTNELTVSSKTANFPSFSVTTMF